MAIRVALDEGMSAIVVEQQMIQTPDYRFDKRFRSAITSAEWREVSTLV
jgi:hypothetical protein